jgi:ferredoxin
VWVFGERGHLVLPSTRRLIRAMGWRRLFAFTFWHAYFYARWTNQYIGWSVKYYFPFIKPVEGKDRWARVYHGKVVPTELAKALITVNQDICLQNLEQLIPYPIARDLILQAPLEIAVYECGCRHARANPCQPTQVCMVVGQPFVDFILEHNPQTSRRLAQQEALDLLQAEHDRGHLHAAYFKDVMLNRFYAICNCCKCCCAGIESMVEHGVPMVMSSGYVAQVDAIRCQACGTCENACPFGAIHVNGAAEVTWDTCMGCGICESQCPNDVITLVSDARKGLPLDVRRLVPEAAAAD